MYLIKKIEIERTFELFIVAEYILYQVIQKWQQHFFELWKLNWTCCENFTNIVQNKIKKNNKNIKNKKIQKYGVQCFKNEIFQKLWNLNM